MYRSYLVCLTPCVQDDFNEEALQIVCEQGDGARFFEQYCAAKVLADRAVLDFVRDEKPSFDCTILLLPHVIGVRQVCWCLTRRD